MNGSGQPYPATIDDVKALSKDLSGFFRILDLGFRERAFRIGAWAREWRACRAGNRDRWGPW